KHHTEAGPLISMLIKRSPAQATLPQAAYRVTVLIGSSSEAGAGRRGLVFGQRRMQQLPLLRTEEKQESVDEPQELLEVDVGGERSVFESLSQSHVLSVGQKPSAE